MTWRQSSLFLVLYTDIASYMSSYSTESVFEGRGWILSERCIPECFSEVGEDGTFEHPETKEHISVEPQIHTLPDNYYVYIALYKPPRSSESRALTPRYIKRLAPTEDQSDDEKDDVTDEKAETNTQRIYPVLAFRRVDSVRPRPLRACIPTLQRGLGGVWRPEYLPGLSFLNNSMGIDSSDSDPESDVNESDEDFDDVSVVSDDHDDDTSVQSTGASGDDMEESSGDSETEGVHSDTPGVTRRRSARLQTQRNLDTLRALSAVQLHYVLYDQIFGANV